MSEVVKVPLQGQVAAWMLACFGREIAADRAERNHRFLEEALETVQAGGCTRHEAHALVDYVFDRPTGELRQEVGGALLTLAALASANDLDMNAAGDAELERAWANIDKIRAKQAAKPKHSPLPQAVEKAPCGTFLWCCHVRGPDDVHAAPDYETAIRWSDLLNAFNWRGGAPADLRRLPDEGHARLTIRITGLRTLFRHLCRVAPAGEREGAADAAAGAERQAPEDRVADAAASGDRPNGEEQ